MIKWKKTLRKTCPIEMFFISIDRVQDHKSYLDNYRLGKKKKKKKNRFFCQIEQYSNVLLHFALMSFINNFDSNCNNFLLNIFKIYELFKQYQGEKGWKDISFIL